MRFLFDDDAGKEQLVLKGEAFKYIIKVRRHKIGDELGFRQREESQTLYRYNIANIDGRSATLELVSAEEEAVAAPKPLHIGWCVVDSNSVEKVLPLLNELGVTKITFIYCDRSQKNFKPDYKRYNRILESSMQQCGRSTRMRFDEVKNIEAFIAQNPQTVVFDFCDEVLGESGGIDTVLIGSEGGLSEAERALLRQQKVVRLDTPMILRSETAATAIASKILL
ncbi:16S rRNA (uracil(1498)-N(3))-methyltransferase [Sulfurimonas sp. HSL3-7]|uniref:16S rRNA (uracil(1498)-N(3))-methyltransferase n=1 Tax=Sulfonitrofixus jiaomeiensis TaxID=3131938 RepID=UPI0031FA34E5